MIRTNHITTNNPSLLASLRALVPARRLHASEAFRLAELQANRLRELSGTTEDSVPTEVVSQLPRVQVRFRQLQTSGMSFWDGHCWMIWLNCDEPATRQRFTLFHELKHIIDHGRTADLYGSNPHRDAETQAEQAADYFAGCALMPKRLVKRAWGNGIQQSGALANQFDVSPRAVEVRLAQLGLTEPRPRCLPLNRQHYRTPPPGAYLRQLSATWMPAMAEAGQR